MLSRDILYTQEFYINIRMFNIQFCAKKEFFMYCIFINLRQQWMRRGQIFLWSHVTFCIISVINLLIIFHFYLYHCFIIISRSTIRVGIQSRNFFIIIISCWDSLLLIWYISLLWQLLAIYICIYCIKSTLFHTLSVSVYCNCWHRTYYSILKNKIGTRRLKRIDVH